MKRIIPAILLCLGLIVSACSERGGQDRQLVSREIASAEEGLEKLLGIDRFHYYINELAAFKEGKLEDEAIDALRKISPNDLIAEGYSLKQLNRSQNYDALIFNFLKEHYPSLNIKKLEIVWNYNFFKNKLNEGFILKPTKMEDLLYHDDFVVPGEKESKLTITNINPDKLTLDSGHYISNRTTRAAFWDAVQRDRQVEFHLGDSREFLKNISSNKAEILYEIKPLARNYNKMFLVKYPGESKYRIAITNIGGADRLQHMIHQLSLSKLSTKQLKNKVVIYGNLEEFHERLFKKTLGQLRHLPHADRVIIGQKGAIDKVFNTHWKIEGLRGLYSKNKNILENKIGAELLADLESILSADDQDYSVFDIKKKVETSYEKVKEIIEKDDSLRPPSFKKFGSNNTTTEMADYVFKNKLGKEIRWRVIGNVWGDEIVPLARALKKSGNNHVTYMGTTGALPGKGYEVGDLVIPESARDAKGKVQFRGNAMEIEGAKTGGIVEHVASPFDETQSWLKKATAQSDMVEIETNYLARIFNGADDHMRAYLLVSDVLGTEGESLAHASSSKRRKSLNSLLNALLKRDMAVSPRVVHEVYDTKIEKLRAMIDELFAKKGATFRYYLFSHFKNKPLPELEDIKTFESNALNFSDKFFSQKVVSSSEALSNIVRRITEADAMPKIGLDRDFIDGRWHPKDGNIKIQIYASSAAQEVRFKSVMKEFSEMIGNVSSWSQFEVVRGPPSADFVSVKPASYIDQDFLVKVYAEAGLRQAGLDYEITYNGNIKYSFLPTEKTTKVCDTAKKFCSLAYYRPDSETRELLDQLKNIPGFRPADKLKQFVKEVNESLASSVDAFKGTVKLTKVSSLPDGELATIAPEFSKTKGLVINLKITNEGLKSPMVVLEEMAHLKQITSKKNGHGYFSHPMFWAEMSKNAEFGSKRSQLFLAKAEKNAMDVITGDLLEDLGLDTSSNNTVELTQKLKKYLKKRKSHAISIVHGLKNQVKLENKKRKAMAKQWTNMQREMENASLKLDDYIAKGDRKKVVELINIFMPWEDMEPTEISSWQKWLKVMKETTTLKKDKVLLFRGLEGDLVRSGAKEGEHFLMSTMLTKNQGSYTRRLRSLKTYRTKMVKKVSVNIPTDISSLSAVMEAHSHEPNGSPFMSAANYKTASRFTDNSSEFTVVAIHIDKSRFLINAISIYNENERLIPLIVFPDEVLVMGKSTKGSDGMRYFDEDKFLGDVTKKLGRSITLNEKYATGWKKNKATQSWWDSINPKEVKTTTSSRSCKKIIQLFLGSL